MRKKTLRKQKIILDNMCNKFYHENKILVTRHARKVIIEILNGILLDPHPSWESSKLENRKLHSKFLYNANQFLSSIADSEAIKTRITTFDFLHWFAFSIDSICPFEKEH